MSLNSVCAFSALLYFDLLPHLTILNLSWPTSSCFCSHPKTEISSSSSVAQSCPTLATPSTVAHQNSLSMGFFSQEYWSGLPFPSPGNLPNAGDKPMSPALLVDSLLIEPAGPMQRLLLLWNMGSKVHGFSRCSSWALEHRLSSCGTRT